MLKEGMTSRELSKYINPWNKYQKKIKKIKRLMEFGIDGFATPYGIQEFKNRFMMEGNHNLLFGTVNDLPVGLCYDSELTYRSMTTFVRADDYNGWTNYTLPNLLAGHSSSVIVGDKKTFMKCIPDITAKGINVYVLDFSDNSTNKYDLLENKGLRAETIFKLFHDNEDIENCPKEIYCTLMEHLFSMLENIENENGLEKAEKIIKYLIHICNIKNPVLDVILADIQSLRCFTIKKLPDGKIQKENNDFTIKKLVNEKTYLFISQPKTEAEEKMTASFLTVLVEKLWCYAENHPKSNAMFPLLKNPVHFYLSNFSNFSSSLRHTFFSAMSVSRQYDMGFSAITYDNYDNLNEDEEGELWINTDIFLCLKTKESEMPKLMKKLGTTISRESIKKALSNNKAIVSVRDCVPFVCDRLNPNNMKNYK